ncbi:MAG: hypothetical protein ACFFDS_09850 [Candidatus Thorarchaeota archaeon]
MSWTDMLAWTVTALSNKRSKMKKKRTKKKKEYITSLIIVILILAAILIVVYLIIAADNGLWPFFKSVPLTWVCPDGTSVIGGPYNCPENIEISNYCSLISSYIPESVCPSNNTEAYGHSVAIAHIQNNASEEECSIHKNLDFDDKMFSFFNDEYLSSINDELEISYSDCVGGITEYDCHGTSRYNCVLTNNDVTYIVYDSPSPCKQFNVVLLPNTVSLENALKSEYASLIEKGVLSTEIPCDFKRCQIKRNITIYENDNKLILKEYHYSCP